MKTLKTKLKLNGLRARVVQHEFDHIEGILFTDKLSSFKKRLIKTKLNNISNGKVNSDYLMSFHVLKSEKKRTSSVTRLLDIMDELREKCPWDREQTMNSLKTLTIEESYELLDAINEKDYVEIKNELGDLLLHIVFYTKIASEKSKFNFYDVVENLIEKLISRHPHVFKTRKIISKEQVEKNWEKIKLDEGKKSILSGVQKLYLH